MSVRVILVLVVAVFLAAFDYVNCSICGAPHDEETHSQSAPPAFQPAGDVMLADEILLEFIDKRHQPGFVLVNEDPYPSTVSDKALNIYVSEFALPEYLATDPDSDMSDGMIPRGSFVIREIVDGEGNVEKITSLFRGPEGYNPTSGDFWFSVTDADGEPLFGEDGKPMVGAIASCSGCHAGRAESDYLFGVPKDVRYDDYNAFDRTPIEQPVQEPIEPVAARGSDIVELTDWMIANVQPEITREQRLDLSKIGVKAGTVIVIGRDATQEEFEAHWGELSPYVLYINEGGAGSFGAPIINGGESWVLRNAAGEEVDGPTPPGKEGLTYQRVNSELYGWREMTPDLATPGVADPGLMPGVYISEWSDAESYQFEFIEIVVQ